MTRATIPTSAMDSAIEKLTQCEYTIGVARRIQPRDGSGLIVRLGGRYRSRVVTGSKPPGSVTESNS